MNEQSPVRSYFAISIEFYVVIELVLIRNVSVSKNIVYDTIHSDLQFHNVLNNTRIKFIVRIKKYNVLS